jgi:SAM-dependent methyltransferase
LEGQAVNNRRGRLHFILVTGIIVFLTAVRSGAQTTQAPFEPRVGQEGKDVVWVPTPPELVEKMLDMAAVTPKDFVVDLGSGDGRNVIAAAKRGARALGVEYNPDMVALSRRLAEEQGVGGRARFVEGDMFEADFSEATVLALFLLPDNMRRLRTKFASLPPGTRIVANTFGIDGWEPDVVEKLEEGCTTWCTAMLWIVPARVEGRWRLGNDEIAFTQEFQKLTGTLTAAGATLPIAEGRLRGAEISFTADGAAYSGRVNGSRMEGTVRSGAGERRWSATRQPSS